MATPKGMSTPSVYKKMMDNPIFQQRQLDARAAEGRNNMAVSQENRALGADIAQEQKRMLGLNRAGEELATRKDQLAYERSVHEFKKERFDISMQQKDQDRARRSSQFSDKMSNTNKVQGIEMGLGLLTLGTTSVDKYREAGRHKELMQELRKRNLLEMGITYDGDYGDGSDEDPAPLDLYGAMDSTSSSQPYWSRR